MSDRTTLLFALPGFRVLDVSLEADGGRRVLVESVANEGGCPVCGVLSGVIKDRPTSRVRDLPHGPVPLIVSAGSAASYSASVSRLYWAVNDRRRGWSERGLIAPVSTDVLGRSAAVKVNVIKPVLALCGRE